MENSSFIHDLYNTFGKHVDFPQPITKDIIDKSWLELSHSLDIKRIYQPHPDIQHYPAYNLDLSKPMSYPHQLPGKSVSYTMTVPKSSSEFRDSTFTAPVQCGASKR